MDIMDAIILGVIEGITEFLPVSSTGHLILFGNVLLENQSLFTKSFDIIIQLGAILAVVAIYWHKLFDKELIKRLAVAFIPTAVIGLAFYRIVKEYLLGSVSVVLWALFIGGVALIVFEIFYKKKKDSQSLPTLPEDMEVSNIGYKKAFIIGIFQSIAIIPGISRSAATIVGGLLFGLSRKTIVEFSFLLAVPTMMAAGGFDFVKNYSEFSADNIAVLVVGFIVSFLVAFVSIKFLLKFIQKHDFISFGIYRILVSAFFFFIIFL